MSFFSSFFCSVTIYCLILSSLQISIYSKPLKIITEFPYYLKSGMLKDESSVQEKSELVYVIF